MDIMSSELLAELEVLSSIFDPDTFFPLNIDGVAKLLVSVDVPDSGITVCAIFPEFPTDPAQVPPTATLLKRGSSSSNAGTPPRARLVAVADLPPIELQLSFPCDYPVSQPPAILIRAPWLSCAATNMLQAQLLAQFSVGESCVFQWHTWLRSEAISYLFAHGGTNVMLDIPLQHAAVRLLRHSKEGEMKLPSNNSPADSIATAIDRGKERAGTIRCFVISVDSIDPSSGPAAGLSYKTPLKKRQTTLTDLASDIDVLLEYDLTARRRRWLTSMFSCPICLEDRLGEACLALSGCGQGFCRACLREHVRECLRNGLQAPAVAAVAVDVIEGAAADSRVGVACPDVACRELMSHHDIRSVLVPEYADEFAR